MDKKVVLVASVTDKLYWVQVIFDGGTVYSDAFEELWDAYITFRAITDFLRHLEQDGFIKTKEEVK